MAFSLAILDEGITDATKSQLVKQSLYEYDYLFGDAETDNGDPITHANSVFRAAVGVSGAIGFLDLKIGDEFGGLNGLVELALRDLAAIGPSYGLATINMSFSTSRYPVYADEIASLAQQGVLVVAASGNDGSHDALERLPFPARLPGVITVGSHDGRGNPSDFSSNGPGVDLLADGEGVPRPNAFGTSYAAPQVAVTVTHVQAIAQGLAGSRLDTAGMIDVLHQGGAGPLSRADPADGRTRYFLHDHEGALDYAWSRSGGTPTRALEYVASHGDLVAAIGADPEAGRRHFEHAGSVEGRSITFDALGLPRHLRRSPRSLRGRPAGRRRSLPRGRATRGPRNRLRRPRLHRILWRLGRGLRRRRGGGHRPFRRQRLRRGPGARPVRRRPVFAQLCRPAGGVRNGQGRSDAPLHRQRPRGRPHRRRVPGDGGLHDVSPATSPRGIAGYARDRLRRWPAARPGQISPAGNTGKDDLS